MSEQQALTDEALMDAYIGGDPTAFEELFRRYAPLILGLIRRDVRRQADAEDLVQTTFLHLHRARNDFRSGNKLRPWLMTIAFNLKREYFRRKGRKPDPEPLGPATPEASEKPRTDDRRAAQQLVARALDVLPESQRQVIEMHWFAELSYEDIARALGTTLGAVKLRAHRGYTTMRSFLAELK